MNYRHSYHAGSFADVFKHVLLVSLIQALSAKNKPFCYVETHAGIGLYDLEAATAQKTQEFANGIGRLWNQALHASPKAVTQYSELVHLANPSGSLRFYPGSPRFVRNMLRPEDKMILCELHPEDVLLLKAQFPHDKQVAIHHLDGYQALKALIPPALPRGLVLIDPPFEKTDEFTRLVESLPKALQRWSTATYAIWFPIKNRSAVNQFYKTLQTQGLGEITACEFTVPNASALTATGMIVIRPLWQWATAAEKNLQWLAQQWPDANYRLWTLSTPPSSSHISAIRS